MNGLMMRQRLLISSLLVHAERHHGEQLVVSRRVEGDLHRQSYRALAARARRLANALDALALPSQSTVGTLAWNGYRHMELYYAVSGSGRVLHTINPRLHEDQLAYVVDHAHDQVLCFDLSFLPLVEKLAPRLGGVRHFVLMCDRDRMPAASTLPALHCYEDLVDAHDDAYDWPELDEESASSLCYTSGTTGHPKGVLYSHRSTVLHTMASAWPDALNLSARDVVLPVVPMFHVNAWGLPYAACMVGAKLVLPGPALDGASLHALFESEGVTLSAGVPTVWQGLLAHVDSQQLRFSTMRRTIIGGAACPPTMMRRFQETYGVQVVHAWGMTELSPIGTVCQLKPTHDRLDLEARETVQAKQGRSVFGIDMKIVDAAGRDLPWDGRSAGELMVRGHWVMGDYLRSESPNPLCQDAQGRRWFPTGDMATIDADGFMQITDRAKDVIKSGGEWISSIDIENLAMAHPAVAMAACIGVPHPKWDERPVLLVVRRAGQALEAAQLLDFLEGKMARWWTPDAVLFVDSLALGATGKVQKAQLREQHRELLNGKPTRSLP
ncbi:MAG: long-chain-fatty-acid--CoA ligase [Paucibacter sp.]|nr:long-chain-fatty-acid--CoA ligase [Roseateles sp.]